MKTLWRLQVFIGCLSLLLLAETALAHDGWIEVPATVEKGQPVTIALMLGNHTNDHKSYRLAGKWEPRFTKLLILEPSGKVTDLTSSLVDLGEDDEKTGPKGPKGFHIATARQRLREFTSFWRARNRYSNMKARNFAALGALAVRSQFFEIRVS